MPNWKTSERQHARSALQSEPLLNGDVAASRPMRTPWAAGDLAVAADDTRQLEARASGRLIGRSSIEVPPAGREAAFAYGAIEAEPFEPLQQGRRTVPSPERFAASRLRGASLTRKIAAMAPQAANVENSYASGSPVHDIESQVEQIKGRISALNTRGLADENHEERIEPAMFGGDAYLPDAANGDAQACSQKANPEPDPRIARARAAIAAVGSVQAPTDGAPRDHTFDDFAEQVSRTADTMNSGRAVASGAAEQATTGVATTEAMQRPRISLGQAKSRADRLPEFRVLRSEDEKASRSIPLSAIVAGVVAVLGGIYAMTDFNSAQNMQLDTASLEAGIATGPRSNLPVRTLNLKKPLGSRFSVARITGVAGESLPVKISLPLDQLPPESLLLIRAVRDGVVLEPAQKVEGDWAVRLEDVPRLTLKTPDGFSGWFSFDVILQRNGAGPAETRVGSVEITSAGQPASADRKKAVDGNAGGKRALVAPEIEVKLLARAKALWQTGDHAGARAAYQHLATYGSAQGALFLARSYDPEELTQGAEAAAEADSNRAAEWYRKAAELGALEAVERVARLESKN